MTDGVDGVRADGRLRVYRVEDPETFVECDIGDLVDDPDADASLE